MSAFCSAQHSSGNTVVFPLDLVPKSFVTCRYIGIQIKQKNLYDMICKMQQHHENENVSIFENDGCKKNGFTRQSP